MHAYCLLKDGYHLVVKTPEANLSRFMRQVDGLYTQQYQKMKGSDGSLFRGRYKAVLVQAEKYLLPLSSFVHTRVKASELNSYPWSSYTNFTRKAKPPIWFNRDETLKQLHTAAAKRANRLQEIYCPRGIGRTSAFLRQKESVFPAWR